jgi:hypothetical protein
MNAQDKRRSHGPLHIAAIITFLIAPASAMGTEFHIVCPAKVNHTLLRIESPPEGWLAGTQGALLLTAAAPMDGPPRRLITLKPDASFHRYGQEIDLWRLKKALFPKANS